MKRPFYFLFLLLLTGSIAAFSQESKYGALDSLTGTLLKQMGAGETEKAYLTTDKTIYTAGDAVWFRSLLLRSVSERISTRSKYLFVDLVDEKDSVLKQSLLYARDQQTGGKLLLPDSLPTGYYWVRAYTRTMLNNEADGIAVTPLYVVNPADPTPSRAKAMDKSAGEAPPIVEMFPEGGSLVTGINTAIGFYVHDKAGNPMLLSGTIRDNRDTVVARFTTNRLGLSKAEFSPDFRRKYKAVVSYKEKEFSFPLPPYNPFAGQLSARMISGNLLKLRTILEDSLYRRDAVTYLVGLSKDSLCFASTGHGSYETDVPLSNFPMGIATFLLFDKNFKLLSERSVYVKENHLNISASLDKAAYAKRSKVTLSTAILDKSGNPVPSSLTISVSENNALPGEEAIAAENLVQRVRKTGLGTWDLLRLSALPEEDIDLLLFSSPSFYRRATAEKRTATEVADDSLFYLHGRLMSLRGEPLARQALNLISREGNGIFASDTTDAQGRFSFAVWAYPDSTQFMIQAGNAKAKFENFRVVMESMPFPRLQTPAYLKQRFSLSSGQRAAYARQFADTTLAGNGKGWLNPVNLNTKSKPHEGDSRRLASSGTVLTSEQLMKLGMGNIGIGILRLPGVQLINGFLRFYGPDQFSGANSNSEPTVMVDGNQLSLSGAQGGTSSSPVIQYLNTLNPREIDFIEVLKGSEASIYGLRGSRGVIHIHTASHIHQDFTAKDGNVYKFMRQGYAKPALFPLVSYGQKGDKELSLTDNRSTLYWNENVLAESNGRSVFTFFSNDIPGNYKVVISGITARGHLFYKTLTFTNR